MKRTTYEDKATKGTATLEKNSAAVLYTTHDMPKCQFKLKAPGKKIFKSICDHLIQHNTLCKVDAYYISVAAHQYDIYAEMNGIIEVKEAALVLALKVWQKKADELEAEMADDDSGDIAELLNEHIQKMPGSGGYFQTFKNGVVQPSPYFTTMNKAFDNFEKACRNLGLQVKARDPLLAFSKKASTDDDPNDEFGLNDMARKIKKN